MTPGSAEASWVAVGRVTRAHGVGGEVAVIPMSVVDARFERGSRLYLGPSTNRPLVVKATRKHGNRLLVSFERVDERTSAESMTGEYLFVPSSEVPALPEGEYWPHELVGCSVVTESGRELGHLREVMRTQANDVWAADGPEGEVLIPALREVVVSVDLPGRRIVVREVPGLIEP